MKKIIIALACALFGSLSVATAQDLKLDRKGAYVTGTFSYTDDTANRTVTGLVAGYQVHQNLRVEGAYDYAVRDGRNGHTLVVNAVPQYRLPGSVVTPYVLLGAGYGFEGAGVNGDAKTLWNAGAGVRIGLSQSWELDGRYRYVNHFDNHWNDSESHVITAGISYRF